MSSFFIFSSNSYHKKWKYYNKLIIFIIHGIYKILRFYQHLILHIFLILIRMDFYWACKILFLKCFVDNFQTVAIYLFSTLYLKSKHIWDAEFILVEIETTTQPRPQSNFEKKKTKIRTEDEVDYNKLQL